MTPEQLVAWLRDEDDGMKTPCLEAADLIESLSSKLDSAEMLVREIVAWFDVLDNIETKGIPEWPRDWLRRARATVSGTGEKR